MANGARRHRVCTSDKAQWNSLYKTACRPADRISPVLDLDANVCEPTSEFTYLFQTIMADSNRIVFPDEVAEAKANAAAVAAAKAQDKTSGGDSNTVEEPPKEVVAITTRNMITVPSNCPPGYKMSADGVCREVFD